MLCQQCNQRDATVHFTKIVNHDKQEYHLCETCARERGDFMMMKGLGGSGFSFHNLLSGLLGFEQGAGQVVGQPAAVSQHRCGTCGLSYQQFAQVGRFGCSDCYKYFSGKLEPLLRRIHGGATSHTGKVPLRGGVQIKQRRQLETLRKELQQKIQHEQFEEAAVLRDRIRELEMQIASRQEGV
jgi:protein arginine kinase activator